MLSIWYSNFAMPKHTNVIQEIGRAHVWTPVTRIDLILSSFFLMHLHLVLCFTLLNMFLFVYFRSEERRVGKEC